MALSEQPLGGRHLLIKRSDNFEGRPEGAASALPGHLSKSAKRIADRQKNPVGPTLFIGNLGFEATSEAITELFDKNARATKQWQPKQPRPSKKDSTKAEDDEESASDEDAEDKPAEDGAKPVVKGAGIRKVRMGTFEDTGRCKGWAFVDFLSPAQATATLLNARNHSLWGRDLVVEYASLDAVRRGGNKVAAGAMVKGASARPRRPRVERNFEEPAEESVMEPEPAPVPIKQRGDRQAGKGARGGPTGPPRKVKPGAALAKAQRAQVGVVASTGTKVKFD